MPNLRSSFALVRKDESAGLIRRNFKLKRANSRLVRKLKEAERKYQYSELMSNALAYETKAYRKGLVNAAKAYDELLSESIQLEQTCEETIEKYKRDVAEVERERDFAFAVMNTLKTDLAFSRREQRH